MASAATDSAAHHLLGTLLHGYLAAALSWDRLFLWLLHLTLWLRVCQQQPPLHVPHLPTVTSASTTPIRSVTLRPDFQLEPQALSPELQAISSFEQPTSNNPPAPQILPISSHRVPWPYRLSRHTGLDSERPFLLSIPFSHQAWWLHPGTSSSSRLHLSQPSELLTYSVQLSPNQFLPGVSPSSY